MKKKDIIIASLTGILAIGSCIAYASNSLKIGDKEFDGLKYSIKADILSKSENNEEVKKILDEIAMQDRSIERELYDKIPDTAIKNEDATFNKMTMNSGRYFEKIDDEKNSKLLSSNSLDEFTEVYERKISDEDAIKIASEEIKSALNNQKAEKVTAEFVLYTNLYENIEKRPIVLVTFDGIAMGTPQAMKNRKKINQTQVYVDSLTGDILEIVSRGHN